MVWTMYQDLLRGLPLERRIGWSFLFLLAAGGMLSTALAQASTIAIIVLFLADRIRTRSGWVWSQTLLDLTIPLLALARVMSIIFSVDPGASITSLRTELPFYVLPFALLWLFEDLSQRRLESLIRVLIAGAIAASLIGVVVYAGGFFHRATSITSGYYTLGMYLTAILGLVLGIGRAERVFGRTWVWYATLGILLLGILLTFNRIHWLMAGMLVLAVGVMRERALLAGLGTAAAAAIAAYVPLRERIMTVFLGSGGLTNRDIIWQEALRMGWEHPLIGFGTRTFSSIFPAAVGLNDPGVASWHNDTLQIYMESGILAALCYVLLMVVPLWLVFRRAKGGILMGNGLALVSIFMSGMTGIFFTDPIILPMTYMFIALIVSESRGEGVESTEDGGR